MEVTTNNGRATGSESSDILNLTIQNDKGSSGQIHSFAMGGNDITKIFFSEISNFSHGSHMRGDRNGVADGHDVFQFLDVENVSTGGLVVGRIEDFDYSRDSIKIGDETVDLSDIDSFANISIVGYGGAHTSFGMENQQWLRIQTSSGGNVLYALEGARIIESILVDPEHNHLHSPSDNDQERHFPYVNEVPNLDELVEVAYVDPVNFVPAGEQVRNGVVINDFDTTLEDVRDQTVDGSQFDDLIAAGLNNDVVYGHDGDDKIWGGSGSDTVDAGNGNDTIFDGTGDDSIFGNSGNDLIFTSHGNETISGGGGSDWFTSDGIGTDRYDGGSGSYDSLSYSKVSESGVVASLLTNSGNGGSALGDTYSNLENLTGSSWSDVLAGNNDRNILRGMAGGDKLKGNGGNDRISGGKGNDTIDGGANYDYAIFDGLRDDFDISKREDTVYVVDTNFSDGNEGRDQLTRVEVLIFEDATVYIEDFHF